MKLKLIAGLASLPLLGNAATTITATNSSGANTQQVVSNSGEAVNNGTYSIGFFDGEVAPDFANFVRFGEAVPFSTSPIAAGIFGAFGSGGASADLSNSDQPNDNFIGRNIFVFVPDPTNASQAIIFDSGVMFASESTLDAGPAVGIDTTNLTPILGRVVSGGNSGLGGPAAGANGGDAITFAAIPEPSSALLAGLALVGGLVRRRR